MTLAEIAARIDAHLTRLPRRKVWADHKGVRIEYDTEELTHPTDQLLMLRQAEAYLAWLDAGGVGRHFEMEKKEPPA